MTNRNADDSPFPCIPSPVRLFLLVALALNALAVFVELYARCHLHLHWPYSSPLLNESPVIDLVAFDGRLQFLHTRTFFAPLPIIPFGYPAPVVFLYDFFYKAPHRVAAFLFVSAAIAVVISFAFADTLSRRTSISRPSAWLVALGALLLSYPLAFQMKQGNMEIFVFCIVTLGIWCFVSGYEHPAASLFAGAAAMKIFPFVYLALFISKRRFAPLLTAFVVGTVVTVGSLYYVCPSVSYSAHGVSASLANFQRIVTLRIMPQTGFDHSAFGCIKIIAHRVGFPETDLPSLLRVYLGCAALVGAFVYFVWIRKLPIINQVLCLCVASIFLPPVSFDYTLLHLYVPWAMLVFLACRTWPSPPRGTRAAFVCLAILTSIQTEFIFRGNVRGGQIKALVLVVLLAIALRNPFTASAADPAIVEAVA